MPSNKIIMRTPYCSPICDRNCSIELGHFLIVDKKKWDKLGDFFEEKSFHESFDDYYEFMFCRNYDANKFMKDCEIVHKNPPDSLLNFFEKFDRDDIIDELSRLEKVYYEKYHKDE